MGNTPTTHVSIPTTGIKIPAEFLWGVLLFLFIPYINEIRENKIHPIKLFKKQLETELCAWSRAKKNDNQSELSTPLIRVSLVGSNKLVWSCKYHQAGKNEEPSYEVISNVLNTLRLSFISLVKVFLSLTIIDVVTLPILMVVVTILHKFILVLNAHTSV
jgi:hypothetical protein